MNKSDKPSKMPFGSMKKFLVFLIFPLLLATCKKDDKKDGGDTPLDIEELYYQTMKPEADAVLLSNDPITGFTTLAGKYAEMPEVKSVEVNESGLFVEFQNNKKVSWMLGRPVSDVETIDLSQIKASVLSSGIVTKATAQKKVCIVNQLSNDEKFKLSISYWIKRLKDEVFEPTGWQVYSIIDGSAASVEFFRKDMSDYDAVFIITHGGYDKDDTWLTTGETLGTAYEYAGMGISNITEKRDGELKIIEYHKVSAKFFEESDLNFSSSIIYLDACHLLKPNALGKNALAGSFTGKGANAVIGWDNVVCSVGDTAGFELFKHLAQCKSVEEIRATKDFPRIDNLDHNHKNADGTVAKNRTAANLRIVYANQITDYCFCTPAPITLDADIKAGGVTLHGMIPGYGGAPVTERGFLYATYGQTEPTKVKDESFDPSACNSAVDAAYSVTLTELPAGVECRFLAYAVAGGTEYYAEEYKSFMTPEVAGKTMTMTVATNRNMSFSLSGSGTVTVDWGDGTAVEMIQFYYGGASCSHGYTGVPPYTITVTGDLKALFCTNNQLTSLNVSGAIMLEALYCSGNQLTDLDVSGAAALETLECEDNQLASLDVSGLTALKSLDCFKNQLTSLDLSGATALESLDCYSNKFTSLNVSGLTALKTLDCYNNKQLASLNLSGAIALETLNCYDSQLASLSVSGLTALKTLHCYNNKLTGLNVSGATALETLKCTNNLLTGLDVSGLDALKILHCYSNLLTSLNVNGCTALTELSCFSNQLTSLNVNGCTALTELTCSMNQLTSLNVSGCTALTELDCYHNRLTSLDVSGLNALYFLSCTHNQLTGLNVDGATALTQLGCQSNQLTSLNVSGLNALKSLHCYLNRLTSLDVSGLNALTGLDCSENRLTGLNVSGATALKELKCYLNQLTGLDMSGLNVLTYLECDYNYMTAAALNSLFSTLNSTTGSKSIIIGHNGPNEDGTGTNACDRTIAQNKGWTVTNQ
ncbi:MAG: hypothetical protein LBL24_11970 [Bacteroidales bacterium]|jgi:hypothetical protein|nr:hypothetical protein [Bacteroidales bacterium]